MHHAGVEITFQGVADRAGVSRQWLYKNPELRAEVEKLRAPPDGPQPIPAAQRASDASLRQRNVMLLEENKRLRARTRSSSRSSRTCSASGARSRRIKQRANGRRHDRSADLDRRIPQPTSSRSAAGSLLDAVDCPLKIG